MPSRSVPRVAIPCRFTPIPTRSLGDFWTDASEDHRGTQQPHRLGCLHEGVGDLGVDHRHTGDIQYRHVRLRGSDTDSTAPRSSSVPAPSRPRR